MADLLNMNIYSTHTVRSIEILNIPEKSNHTVNRFQLLALYLIHMNDHGKGVMVIISEITSLKSLRLRKLLDQSFGYLA